MLTKSDLEQIRKIIREEVGNESQALKDELGADVTLSQLRIRSEISELKDRIKNLEIRLASENKESEEGNQEYAD